MRLNKGLALSGAIAVLLQSSCGDQQSRAPSPSFGETVTPLAKPAMVSDDPVKIGQAYSVDNITYTPQDAANYDELGYAGWYGEELHGNVTANGETFVATAVSAAHRTLPLPSYVEVTALDSGRTILVRINDRGPFANDRIIDLSRGAATQLGIVGDGAVAVRVRRVNPPEQDRTTLRAHGQVMERLETPPALLAALRDRLPARAMAIAAPDKDRLPAAQTNRATPKPGRRLSSRGGYVVQVAAFSSRSRAEVLATRIGANIIEGAGLWRVRFGPYATQTIAQAGVRAAAVGGFENAHIMANDAR